MADDGKIFREDGPGWLRRAIQVRQHEARQAGDVHRSLALVDELLGAKIHTPDADGVCIGCLPDDTRPWPCHRARHLFRQHRGEVGWRPHWDKHIEGAS